MSYVRENLPAVLDYFEAVGQALRGPGKWKTTGCSFHGGSDSMRVNSRTGAWVCMACGEKGGDVLAHHMRLTGDGFIEAAKALGAWVDDGKPAQQSKPTPLPARAALQVLEHEANLAAVAACNVANGRTMSEADRSRLLTAANRIHRIAEAFQ